MNTEADIEMKFWKAIDRDRTAMLGLVGAEAGHSQPMTAQILHEADERGPIWFFSAKEVDLVRATGSSHAAMLHFSSKGHDLFASLQGELFTVENRVMVDRLWNPFVAAWYEGGRDDPKLQLLRFEPHEAQVWLNEHSLMAGVKLLLGRDPKNDYKDKVADIHMGH
jgi:general stress protein 26